MRSAVLYLVVAAILVAAILYPVLSDVVGSFGSVK